MFTELEADFGAVKKNLNVALKRMRAEGVPSVTFSDDEIPPLVHAEEILRASADGLGNLVIPQESADARQFVCTVSLPAVRQVLELMEEYLWSWGESYPEEPRPSTNGLVGAISQMEVSGSKKYRDSNSAWDYVVRVLDPTFQGLDSRTLLATRCMEACFEDGMQQFHAGAASILEQISLRLMGQEWCQYWIERNVFPLQREREQGASVKQSL